jgi:sterol desaturase/sphingolipid hydroxylase (fatty acid hydroxylase superfamily)
MMESGLAWLRVLFPLLVAIALLEALLLQRSRQGGYDWRESAASLGVALGQRVSGMATVGVIAGIYGFAWEYRLATIPADTGWGALLVFMLVEFVYYWHHRLSHECRWFWASHSVHHSATQLNLSASYRLGWTAGLTGAGLLYLPLMIVGVSPVALFVTLGGNLLYQYWLHAEWVPKLGAFEWLFNTPSHHRVHHACNPAYLDRNYGGVLVVFDRLFGTWAEERAEEPCRYGLVHAAPSYNPFRIAFREWIAIVQDLRAARSAIERWKFLFGAPGWRPDGRGATTAELRRKEALLKKEVRRQDESPHAGRLHA